jgi:hypothetical protein
MTASARKAARKILSVAPSSSSTAIIKRKSAQVHAAEKTVRGFAATVNRHREEH